MNTTNVTNAETLTCDGEDGGDVPTTFSRLVRVRVRGTKAILTIAMGAMSLHACGAVPPREPASTPCPGDRMQLGQQQLAQALDARAAGARRIAEGVWSVQAEVSGLLQPCSPSQPDHEGCAGAYFDRHERIGRDLEQLTHEIPLVFGPGSPVGIVLDNAYVVRRLFASDWYEQDRRYARCLHEDTVSCQGILDIRNSYLDLFSNCMLITSCLVSDAEVERMAVTKSIIAQSLGLLEQGELPQGSSPFIHALDELYSPSSSPVDASSTCPELDLVDGFEAICLSTEFDRGTDDDRRMQVCPSWRERYYDEEKYPLPAWCSESAIAAEARAPRSAPR